MTTGVSEILVRLPAWLKTYTGGKGIISESSHMRRNTPVMFFVTVELR